MKLHHILCNFLLSSVFNVFVFFVSLFPPFFRKKMLESAGSVETPVRYIYLFLKISFIAGDITRNCTTLRETTNAELLNESGSVKLFVI